ncbi:unnamed protein product [Schistocephalus solidus]|uniref:Protein FAM228B n=1 Tax=Schistocephalus solidus TaxID=70667 RepID=A0A183S9G4_SCHSO|nr:unnamed protein product [Schistocephalus solidus]
MLFASTTRIKHSHTKDSKMARNFPAETRAQKVYEERFEKELVAQLRYFYQCKDELDGKATNFDLSPANELRRRRMKIVSDSLMKQFLEKSKPKDIKSGWEEQSPTGQVTESEEWLTVMDLNEMAPVDPELRKLIYDDTSRECTGRAKYLMERAEIPPDQRYRLPVTSSMQYGWDLASLVPLEEITHPKFGRLQIIKSTFYKENGLPIKHREEML